MEDLEPPNTTTTTACVVPLSGNHSRVIAPTTDAAGEDSSSADIWPPDESYDMDSNCSTPYVSAPSSPTRAFGGGGYFYSAPASPMHYVLSTASLRSSGFVPSTSEASETGISSSGSFEFDFSARFASSYNDLATAGIGSMTSADELFLNGQIRPLKLSTHLQRPQVLAPLVDEGESDGNGGSCREMGEVEERDFDRKGENVFVRSRDLRLWNKSLRRRTRSLSPFRNTTSFDWSELVINGEDDAKRLGHRAKMMLDSQNNGDGDGKAAGDEIVSNETTPSASASSSRCSSAGRSSKRWVFLKDFLRSKSEGRSNHKFWTNISFSPAKEKKPSAPQHSEPVSSAKKKSSGSDPPPETQKPQKKPGKEKAKKSRATAGKPANGVGKRRVPLSAHEQHYTANRAQAEEMRKKTYLPYRQGLLGCLGFSSKSYGAMNGFARALNPVSSR